jgi:hypothetical protein
MRKTRLSDRSQWEAQVIALVPKVRRLLEAEQGFVSVEYAWGAEDDGGILQLTTWQTLADCRRHVREGGAAMLATLEEKVIPTAGHPDGTWVRRTYETAG